MSRTTELPEESAVAALGRIADALELIALRDVYPSGGAPNAVAARRADLQRRIIERTTRDL